MKGDSNKALFMVEWVLYFCYRYHIDLFSYDKR